MAFSTQRDFFHVPFMNETMEFECIKECVKLKTYDSAIDDRAWALNVEYQSHYFFDVVTCNFPIKAYNGFTHGSFGRRRFPGDYSWSKGDLVQPGVGGDSLLGFAITNLGKVNDILRAKKSEQQLQLSNENLQNAREENEKIKTIIYKKIDRKHNKDFAEKIKALSAAGKISKGDEKELNSYQKKTDDMIKAYEVLQAENNYVKRLVEKLNMRAKMETLPYDPKKSTDINYLQNQLNLLYKEVQVLRQIEDEVIKLKQDMSQTPMPDQDAENIKVIIEERNALREKCKTFKELENHVGELQVGEIETCCMCGSQSNNLDNLTKFIGEMEHEMQRMLSYYEDQMQKVNSNEVLKCQCDDNKRKEELVRMESLEQKLEFLQAEIGTLRNLVMRYCKALKTIQ